MRRGHTLFELCAALLVAAIAASALLPAGRSLLDHMAVVAAREAVAGLVAEARMAALEHGGARVRLEAAPWRGWLEIGDSVARAVPLEEDLRVVVALGRSRTSVTLEYDAMGLGRVASETLRFRRGTQESTLIISGYGRVRRP